MFEVIKAMVCQQPRNRRGPIQNISAAIIFMISVATGAAAQTENLKPFQEADPLPDASAVVRQIMGFELAHGPDGFTFGNYNILAPRIEPQFQTGLVFPGFRVRPLDGEDFGCFDLACVDTALRDGVEFMQPGGRPIPPDSQGGEAFMVALSGNNYELANERARQVVYAKTGILYAQEMNTRIIEAVDPVSPAHRAGLRAGYEMSRVGDSRAWVGLLEKKVMTGEPLQLFWRASPDDRWDTEGGLVPREGPLTVVDGIIRIAGTAQPGDVALPAPLAGLTDEKGLMSLLRDKPDMATEQEQRVAALRVLEGWSNNPNARNCLIAPVVRIDIRTTIEMNERNLAGQSRTSFSASSVDPLFVEERFEPFVRSMSASWSSPESIGVIDAAAARLVQLEGCDGPNVRKLKAGIARLAGVALLPEELAAAAATGFQPDWRQFMAQCYPAYMQEARIQGRNVPDRGAVAMCICMEYGAAEHGDPDIYARHRAFSFDGIPQETLKDVWGRTQNGACNRGGNPVDPELVRRYESFLRDNGL